MTHIPLCQTDKCPHPSDPDFHVPVCGHGLAYHHHHTTKRSRGGALSVQVCICPKCHDRIDNGSWMDGVYDHDDGTVHYFIRDIQGNEKCDEVIGQWKESPDEPDPDEGLELRPEIEKRLRATLPAVKEEEPIVLSRVGPPDYTSQDLSNYSDEDLATVYAYADKNQKEAFLTKCHIIHAYRERHVQAWGQSWIENAYELFDGAPSRRTLEAYANIWICVESDASLRDHIAPLTDSRSLMQHIGRKKPEDGKVAMEAAVAHLAEFGESPTVAALQHRLGEEARPADICPLIMNKGKHRFVCACGKER